MTWNPLAAFILFIIFELKSGRPVACNHTRKTVHMVLLWVGGAMGADMWAAEILLRMKEQQTYQDVELCLALPFEGYDSDWDDWHRKRMDFIRRYAVFIGFGITAIIIV